MYIFYNILSLLYSILLTANVIPLCMKEPVLKWQLAFPFP
jgi:hypothetical protein